MKNKRGRKSIGKPKRRTKRQQQAQSSSTAQQQAQSSSTAQQQTQSSSTAQQQTQSSSTAQQQVSSVLQPQYGFTGSFDKCECIVHDCEISILPPIDGDDIFADVDEHFLIIGSTCSFST